MRKAPNETPLVTQRWGLRSVSSPHPITRLRSHKHAPMHDCVCVREASARARLRPRASQNRGRRGRNVPVGWLVPPMMEPRAEAAANVMQPEGRNGGLAQPRSASYRRQRRKARGRGRTRRVRGAQRRARVEEGAGLSSRSRGNVPPWELLSLPGTRAEEE